MSIDEQNERQDYILNFDDDTINNMYMYFGLVVYRFQVLEHLLSNLLLVEKSSNFTFDTVENVNKYIEETLYSKMMGQLKNILKEKYSFPDEVWYELQEILKLRNEIVHNYFKKDPTFTYSKEKRIEIIEYLSKVYYRIVSLEQRLSAYCFDKLLSLGIPKELVECEINKYLEMQK